LVPDLQHYYGIDLRDLFLDVPPWTPRFLLAHINNLDYNSAFVAQLRGGQQYRGWGEDRYIAASTSNAIRTLVYLFILANKDPRKKSKTAVPTPWPLPDDKDKKKKKQDKPGSFGFMAKSLLSKAKKRREGGG
jgi:hypothetical protein